MKCFCNKFLMSILNNINTVLCPLKSNGNTIELTVLTSCYWGLRLTLCWLDCDMCLQLLHCLFELQSLKCLKNTSLSIVRQGCQFHGKLSFEGPHHTHAKNRLSLKLNITNKKLILNKFQTLCFKRTKTSKSGSMGSKLACGTKDPSSNPLGANQYG